MEGNLVNGQDNVLTGNPKQVLDELCLKVHGISASPLVGDFYIGKTSDPYETKNILNATSIRLLYKSPNYADVEAVEGNLRRLYSGYTKCCNSRYSPQEFYYASKMYYVYIAFWA